MRPDKQQKLMSEDFGEHTKLINKFLFNAKINCDIISAVDFDLGRGLTYPSRYLDLDN